MASLSDKAGILIVANLLKYGVGFVLPMLLVRLLSAHDYGTYQQLALANSLTAAVLLLGLPTSIFYFHARVDGARRTSLQVQTMSMLGMLGLLGAVVLIVGAWPISHILHNPEIVPLLPVVALAGALTMGSEGFISFLIVGDRYRLALGFEVGETVLRVLLMITPLLLGYGLRGLVVALLVYAALRYLGRIGTLYALRDRAARGWRKLLFAREQLAYSMPLAATSWVSVVAGMLDRTIIAMFFSTVDFAIYTVGALEIPLDVIFQASVADVMRATLPRLIAEGKDAEIRRLLSEAVRKLALIVLPSFVFLWLFARPFITVLFTTRYLQSVHVFRIYLLLLPLHMFVLSMVPQAYGETRVNFRIASFVSAVHAVLSLALLKWIGFYGPAISGVLSAYLRSGLFAWANLRLTRSRLSQIVPFGALLRTLLACVAGAAAAHFLVLAPSWRLIHLVLAGLVFSLGYLGAAWALGALTPGDRRLLWSAAARLRLR